MSLYCPLDGRPGCPPGGADACTAAYGRPCLARAAADADAAEGPDGRCEPATTDATGGTP